MATKILIVEDDQAITEMYRLKFETDGFSVETAENGRSGLELAEQMKPDIILLDLMMPEMTGDQVLEKLRATDWGKHIHVIILSNISEDIASPTLRQLGIDRYIVKANYTPTQIVDIIKEVLAAPPAASTR